MDGRGRNSGLSSEQAWRWAGELPGRYPDRHAPFVGGTQQAADRQQPSPALNSTSPSRSWPQRPSPHLPRSSPHSTVRPPCSVATEWMGAAWRQLPITYGRRGGGERGGIACCMLPAPRTRQPPFLVRSLHKQCRAGHQQPRGAACTHFGAGHLSQADGRQVALGAAAAHRNERVLLAGRQAGRCMHACCQRGQQPCRELMLHWHSRQPPGAPPSPPTRFQMQAAWMRSANNINSKSRSPAHLALHQA